MDDNLLLDHERSSATVFQRELPTDRKSAFSAMGALQQVFFCTYNKKKVKIIVGTVGVQVFDLRRKPIITLHIHEMPEWSIGKTIREPEFGSRKGTRVDHWVRLYTGKIAPSLLERQLTGCKIGRLQRSSFWRHEFIMAAEGEGNALCAALNANCEAIAQSQKATNNRKLVDLCNALHGMKLEPADAKASVRPFALATRVEVGAKVWRAMSDDEKLQAIVDHSGEMAATSCTEEVSSEQLEHVQELLPPSPLPEMSVEPMWTPRERYGGRTTQLEQLPAPDHCIMTDGSPEAPESSVASSSTNGLQRGVSFALNDNKSLTFATGSGSTTPRIPPPIATMDASESTGDHDRRSSRMLELEAAASAVSHPTASALLQEAAQHRASTDAALRSAGAEAELQRSIDRDLASAQAELAAATQQHDDGFRWSVDDSGDGSETVTELSVGPNRRAPLHKRMFYRGKLDTP